MSKPVPCSVWVGFEPREALAYAVARQTCRQNLYTPIPVNGIVLSELQKAGIYRRPTEVRDGRLYDVISEHPMATEFAISRFLVPHLAQTGMALFMDCDMLVLKNLNALFDRVDPKYAVSVVKHHHEPEETIKMDGQVQSRYARKNWSSVMLFNCDHPANKKLTIDLINTVPGRDLHQFCWLEDDEIGELSVKWNWLVGHSPKSTDPAIVHFTDGIPTMPGYENSDYAQEWREELVKWAS